MFMRFKGNKHSPFCRCNFCKQKRRTSIFYLGTLLALAVIICYQAVLLLFLVTRIHALLLLIELVLFIVLLVFLIF